MANGDFSKEEIVMFEEVMQRFEPANITMKQVNTRNPEMVAQERSGYRVWKPVPYVSRTVSGISLVDADFTDLTGLAVPFDIDEIENVPFSLTSQDLNDETQLNQKADSLAQAINAVIEVKAANKVALEGTLVSTSGSDFNGFDDIADVETIYLEQNIPVEADKTFILNPSDYNKGASNLAARQTLNGKTLNAFEKANLGETAGFDTFKTSYMKVLPGAALASTTISGAGQAHIPLGTDATQTGGKNVDNRTMTLTVATTAATVAGDCFTIAGVFAVGQINKESTGELKTFRVISVDTGTTLTISPAIVPVDGAAQSQKEYGNVDTTPADTAAVTYINTTTAKVNIHFTRDAIEITGGKLAAPQGGVDTMTMSTSNGMQIIFARQGDIGSFNTKYRATVFFGINIPSPEKCGIMLPNQV